MISFLYTIAANDLLHHRRIVFHLQLVFLFGYVVDAVVRRDRYAELRDDFTTIANRSNLMNGHARFRFAGSLHGLVHMVSPHALSTELWQ